MSRRRARGLWVFFPGLEALEARRVPAQFGVPWHDPEHLSVSFVPDGTAIAGDRSNLFALLDAAAPTAAWQAQILGAFRSWAAAARISFALEPDDGSPMGTPGPDQGDPRFGDIRIGARPMSPEVLSISVPHDPFLSGTWSGDILLNSNIPFGRGVNLVPVVLHEIGHVLGLGESTDSRSVMFGHFDGARTSLSREDVQSVEALYDPPEPDRFEGRRWNDRLETATPFPTPAGYDGATPLLLYAGLSEPTDTDLFTIQPPAGYDGPMTVRVQTAGVSLLAPRLAVLGGDGGVLDEASSTAAAGDTLQVTVPRADPGATYFVQVRAAPGDAIGVGKYALAVSFDARSTAGPEAIDRLARQSYDYLSPEGIEAIFRDPQGALFADDHHSDDSMAAAAVPTAIGIYGSDSPYRLTASLGDRADVDFYRIETPEKPEHDYSQQPLVMTATVRVTEVNGLPSRVSVFDRAGRPVEAMVLAHGAGTYTVQVANAADDATYFLRVDHDPTAGKDSGNYELDVEFGHQAATPVDFAVGTLGAGHPRLEYDVVVNEAQLFDFLLAARAAGGASPGSLRLTVDDPEGRLIASRSAPSGETGGGTSVLLLPGVYTATFELEPAATGAMTFRLYGASLSEPIGPAVDDPTLAPVADPSRFGPSPPVLGSPAAPYVWLARTLAGRPGPPAVDATVPPEVGIARSTPVLPAIAIAPAPSPEGRPMSASASAVAAAAAGGPGVGVRGVIQGAVRSSPGIGGFRLGQDVADAADGDRSPGGDASLPVEIDGASPAMAVVLDRPRWTVMRPMLRASVSRPQPPTATLPRTRGDRRASGSPAAPMTWRWAAVDFGPQAAVILWVAATAYDQARRRRRPAVVVPRGP